MKRLALTLVPLFAGCYGTYQPLETSAGNESSDEATDTSDTNDSNDTTDEETGTDGTGGEMGDPCDPFDQTTCAEGHKCNPRGFGDPDTVCVELDPAPHGAFQTCMHFDNDTGADDCEAGTFCYGIDKGGNGVCRPFCDFGNEAICPNSETWGAPGNCYSIVGLSLPWGWCAPWCDPTVSSECMPGNESCRNDGFDGPTEAFFCETDPANGGAQFGESCNGGYDCALNLLCESGVCRTPCDVNIMPGPCPSIDPNSVCEAVSLAPGFPDPPGVTQVEHIGVCSVP
jgi:hypothetical protein